MRAVLALVLFGLVALALGGVFDDGPTCSGNYLTTRTYDGTCNNLEDTDLGASEEFYRRGPEGAQYGAYNQPIGYPQRPIERVASNKIARADPSMRDSIPHSLFATQFGQFINHDFENNRFVSPNGLDYPDQLLVPETNDDFCFIFENVTIGDLTLINACLPPLSQSPQFFTKASNLTVVHGVPEIINDATSYLDLSQIYAPFTSIAQALRSFTGGLLLTYDYIDSSTSPAFIFNLFQYGYGVEFNCTDCPPNFGQTNGQVPVPPLLNPTLGYTSYLTPEQVFVSGDPRIGENTALTMYHTLFIRNHNRHARLLQAANPTWSDEQLFQEARRRNIAEYQAVVLYQYFPTEFGSYFNDLLGPYEGYDCELDVDINIAFATAAFRYGHSSFHNYVPLDTCGNPTLFNQPAFPGDQLIFGGQAGGLISPLDLIGEIGTFENLIRGLIGSVTAPNDIMMDDSLRDIPFRAPVAGGTDLLALDIRRGRENGVPNYNALQQSYGLHQNRIYGAPGCPEKYAKKSDPDPLGCFTNLVPYNATLAANLQSLYGKVNNIDALVGLLVEPHVSGTSFGATLGAIITDQYQRARAGDRFWFENTAQTYPFTSSEIAAFRSTTMGSLIRANFNFPNPTQVPNNPFLTPSNYGFTLSQTC